MIGVEGNQPNYS